MKILILVLMLMVSGCVSLPSDSFAVQYATIKLIEESEVEASSVMETTDRVREIVEEDEELSMLSLASGFRESVDLSSLSASDRLLVDAVISRIQDTISKGVDSRESFFGTEQKITVLRLLDSIDEAAMIYGED